MQEQDLNMASDPMRKEWVKRCQDQYDGFWQGRDELSSLESMNYGKAHLLYGTSYLLPTQNGRSRDLHTLLIASVLIQIMLKIGAVLLAMRRWSLPPGGLTLVFTLNSLLACTLDPSNDYGVLARVLLTGLAADGLYSRLRPTPERPWAFRLFACVIPVVFYLCYFVALLLMKGWWWSVHLWTGAIVLAGLVGWLLSYLILPPREPQVEHDR